MGRVVADQGERGGWSHGRREDQDGDSQGSLDRERSSETGLLLDTGPSCRGQDKSSD